MKARYLGIIFVAAVLVPSILLSVLSIRSAGREEAYVEKQLATTLLAEVTHSATLVSTGVAALADELHASAALLPGSAYQKALPSWKKQNSLVGVPYLLSPGYGILWPRLDNSSTESERVFLEQNADFLSGRAAIPVYANIAVVHKEEVLAEARKLDSSLKKSSDERGAVDATGAAGAAQVESQQAIDTFAQSPAVQAKVYERARQEGEQVNARVAQPTSKALQNAPVATTEDRDMGGKDAKGQAASTVPVVKATPDSGAAQGAPAQAPAPAQALAQEQKTRLVAAPSPPPAAQPSPPGVQPSQYVTTSRLLGQIASQGEYGIIPRFIGDKLTFLFWNRQADGRIIGCEIAQGEFRLRVAGILPSTYSPVRILAVLDESGQPVAEPAGAASRDWKRPFVSQEIGASLPRWEVASYLTDPDSIAAQARSTSAMIWILVLILFVSVAGGGTMVLTSLYSEMRLAQKKASFVANVSHELKTPLTSISLFVDLLRRKRQPDPEKRDRYLAMMAAESERLGRLINNVLDFSSQEKGRKKYSVRRVDLAQVAEQVVEGQRVRLEGLGFTVKLGGPGRRARQTECQADPEALKQVLINLLSNAEKYSPQKKEIDVEVIRTGPEIAVHVRDRGIGVAEKDRERIFLEFVRVDDSLTTRVPGTGLGLTIARRIARDHGGDLVCQSREGGGSDFILRLPVVAPDLEEKQG